MFKNWASQILASTSFTSRLEAELHLYQFSINFLQQLLAPLSQPLKLNTPPTFEPLTNQPARVTQATPIRPSEHPRPTPLPPALPAAALHRRNLPRNPWRRWVADGGRESTSIKGSYQCFCQIRSNKYTNSNYWLGIFGWILSTESGVHHLEGWKEFTANCKWIWICSFLFPAFVPSYLFPMKIRSVQKQRCQ